MKIQKGSWLDWTLVCLFDVGILIGVPAAINVVLMPIFGFHCLVTNLASITCSLWFYLPGGIVFWALVVIAISVNSHLNDREWDRIAKAVSRRPPTKGSRTPGARGKLPHYHRAFPRR